MPAYLLGIDVGTSGAKALLIDEAGEVKAAATTEYPLSTPRPLWSEQDPEDWWSGTVASIKGVLAQARVSADEIECVGLTGQMHGLVLLDASGRVLRPAMLWNDQRTESQCEEIHNRVGLDLMIQRTGKPALPSFTAPKVLWVRQHEPEVFAAAAKLLLPKDYVRFRLTGSLCSDVADASGTSLFDVRNRTWSREITESLDIPEEWLPEVAESPAPSAKVSSDGAGQTGLRPGMPVVAGAGDQAAEAVGCGIVDEGSVSVTIGTSGVMFAATNEMRTDAAGRLHAYCHAVPGMWHVMGVMLSAGGSLQWYRNTLCQSECEAAARRGVDAYELLTEDASEVAAGCEGLIFLPYLTGERTPHPDPYARGAFVGLTLRHNKSHLTRAVLEGVSYGLCDSLDLLRELGVDVPSVRASGGGVRSELWRQILADVFGAEIVTVNATQGAAYGAAILAGVGAGVFPSVEEACQTAIRETSVTSPGSAVEVYRDYHQHYRDLYPALAPAFRMVGQTVARRHGS